MSLGEAILLGFIQGIIEWLPVSSQGILTAVHSFFFQSPLGESLEVALWLHLGTVFSALVALRRDVIAVCKQVVASPTRPSPLIWFLVVSTLLSGVLGFALLLSIQEISEQAGAAAMALVGVLMLFTAWLQLRRGQAGIRSRNDVSKLDGVWAGAAQGFSALPGLSRSGLTVAALLTRGIGRREALVLSFLMSIPASLGASIYAGLSGGFFLSATAMAATAVAFVVGLVTINALLAVAQRVNFAVFVLLVAIIIIAGAVWQVMR